jgi:hypothetical protein
MDGNDTIDPATRETRFEYVYRDIQLGRISDRYNDDAWIESSVTADVEP